MLNFFLCELEQMTAVKNIMKLLHYYKLIDAFLRISVAEDEEKHEKEITDINRVY